MGTLEKHSTVKAMQATLREYMGSEERDRRVLDLTPTSTPLTIGRADACTYKIGQTLGSLALGISKVQATIFGNATQLTLKDGGADGASTNGIYCHAEKIEGSIALVPGLELTLFKHGIAKVTLVINSQAVIEYGKDTYTGQDLLAVMQEQVAAFSDQMAVLHQQVDLLGEQITHREAIDNNQERRLLIAEQRINRVFAGLCGAIAVIVLVSGFWSGSAEDKKLWGSTLTSIACGIAALYFKSKDSPTPTLSTTSK